MEKTFNLLLLFWITLCFAKQHFSSDKKEYHNGSNMCTRTLTYAETSTVPYTERVKEQYKTWCLSFPPRCTTFRYKIVRRHKNIILHKTRIVNDCCKGYEKIHGTCAPICHLGCGHGKCISPDVCLCDKGWIQPNCEKPCNPNVFDATCGNKICLCTNGGTCNVKKGSCVCPEGYIGKHCESSCPSDKYGKDCHLSCKCQNDGLCNNVDGKCDCQPGYFGKYCEKKCEFGKHGKNCKKSCDCFNDTTESCNHIDGRCICKPGWRGEFCEEKCDNFTYGPNCSLRCDCDNSDFCDPLSGECVCKVGWTGTQCSEVCPEGFFGEECLLRCNCPNETMKCNPILGSCICPPGKTGENCNNTCEAGVWGLNCSEVCVCSQEMKCDPETGDCSCWPGWMGANCSELCTDGRYGTNCSKECNCSSKETCRPYDGTCSESIDWKELSEPEQGNSFSHREIFIVIFLFTSCTLMSLCVYCICYGNPCSSMLENIRSKKTNDSANNRSTETFCPYFENPNYNRYNGINVNNETQTEISDSSSSVDGMSKIVSYFPNLRSSLNGSTNSVNEETTGEENKEFNSDLGRASLNDLSAAEARESNIYSTINSRNVSSCYSASEHEKDFEPEKLCEFTITEDIYQTIKDLEFIKNENVEEQNEDSK